MVVQDEYHCELDQPSELMMAVKIESCERRIDKEAKVDKKKRDYEKKVREKNWVLPFW